ncbi:MAG: hypothetical protein LBP22_11785 [Deltaproteobacteria bacterium]|nr:hypothetical protein [Deltaproteobacteria bacterium]
MSSLVFNNGLKGQKFINLKPKKALFRPLGFILTLLLVWVMLFQSPAWGETKKVNLEPEAKPLQKLTAQVGEIEIKLVGPQNMKRVDGLNPAADQFIASMVDRFKLRVLAVYAEPQSFLNFADGLSTGQGRTIPRMAMITVPSRMDKKSYDEKAVNKEKRRYREWYSLAINTRPIAWFFARKANTKLSEKLGLDVNFTYLTGRDTRRFDEKDRSLSFCVLSSMELYGAKTDFFMTASMVNVADKLIFLSWVEPSQSPDSILNSRNESLKWLDEMAAGNGVTLKPLTENKSG